MIEFKPNIESKYDDYLVISSGSESVMGWILKEDHGYYFSSNGAYLLPNELRTIANKLESLNG